MSASALEHPRRQVMGYFAPLGLLLVAVISLAPLCFERRPVEFIAPYTTDFARGAAKILVVVLLCIPLAVRDWVDRNREPKAALLTSLFLIVAGLMTLWHGYFVDADKGNADWQRQLYWDILNKHPDENGLRVPHQFRPLPYGFVRALEWITGDWWFSCIVYRWFFTFWFLWGAHRFARLFLPGIAALATLAPLVALYPLSIANYRGQLTDPLSHALFVMALIYVVQDRWLILAATLALGVMAKETVLLVAVSYYACYWRKGWPALLKTAALGAACVAAFLAVRLPLGWRPGSETTNGTGLMIGTNLGLGKLWPSFENYEITKTVARSYVPLEMNYIHPLLFTVPFLPFIIWSWRRIDGRLQAIFLTLTPLLLLSNLCFGWMYESRNYMPLAPLLATMAAQAFVTTGLTEQKRTG